MISRRRIHHQCSAARVYGCCKWPSLLPHPSLSTGAAQAKHGAWKKEVNLSSISQLAVGQERAFMLLGGWGMHNELQAK